MSLTWQDAPRASTQDLRVGIQIKPDRELRLDGVVVGRVHADWSNWRAVNRWHWACPAAGRVRPARSKNPTRRRQQAEAECEAYVRRCLGLPPKEQR